MRATGAVRLCAPRPPQKPNPTASGGLIGGFIIQHLLPPGARRVCARDRRRPARALSGEGG